MNYFEVLMKLFNSGARVWIEHDRVRIKGPRGVVTDEIRRELKAHEGEIRDWLKETVKAHAVHSVLERAERPERLPLSYAQQRLWFLDQLGGTSTEYNMPGALRLRGKLDEEALEKAINRIVERHESLRTSFSQVDGEAVQVIEEGLRIEVPEEDLSGLGEAAQR